MMTIMLDCSTGNVVIVSQLVQWMEGTECRILENTTGASANNLVNDEELAIRSRIKRINRETERRAILRMTFCKYEM